jgi:hypothetical protein
MVEMGNSYNILVGISQGKRSNGRLRCEYEDNINKHIKEKGV